LNSPFFQFLFLTVQIRHPLGKGFVPEIEFILATQGVDFFTGKLFLLRRHDGDCALEDLWRQFPSHCASKQNSTEFSACIRLEWFSPENPHLLICPSSGCATFSHPMGEGNLPLPRARNPVRRGMGRFEAFPARIAGRNGLSRTGLMT